MPRSSDAQRETSRTARVAMPRRASVLGDPVADLRDAAVVVDAHEADRAEQRVVARVDDDERGFGARRPAVGRVRDPAPRRAPGRTATGSA